MDRLPEVQPTILPTDIGEVHIFDGAEIRVLTAGAESFCISLLHAPSGTGSSAVEIWPSDDPNRRYFVPQKGDFVATKGIVGWADQRQTRLILPVSGTILSFYTDGETGDPAMEIRGHNTLPGQRLIFRLHDPAEC